MVNSTWINVWHPRATWEDGMNVKVTHGNDVSLKWRMKKKILFNGKCDTVIKWFSIMNQGHSNEDFRFSRGLSTSTTSLIYYLSV